MKNNKGFVVSAVLYPLLVLFLALIMGLISMSSTRKNILDNMKMEISDSIFDSVTCDCEVINSTLKKYGQSIKNIENDITAIENDINTINTNQTTLSTNLGNLTTRVTSLETNVTSLKNRVTTIENNYATKTTTTALDNKITALTSTVNSINTNLTNLTNRVNTLAQQELTIYMSPSGNDSYDGLSSAKPMKTLNAVLNKYSNPSLLIRLATGTYDWGFVSIKNRTIYIAGSYNQNGTLTNYFDMKDYWSNSTSCDMGSCLTNINMSFMINYSSTVRMYGVALNFTGGTISNREVYSPYDINKTGYMDYYFSDIERVSGTSDASYMAVNSTLHFIDVSINNENASRYSTALAVVHSNLNARHFGIYGNARAFKATAQSAVWMDYCYLETIYEAADKVISSTIETGSGSYVNIAGAHIQAATANDYYAWKTTGSTLIITYYSKKGKTAGSPTVSAVS